jgi:hypothetical protein
MMVGLRFVKCVLNKVDCMYDVLNGDLVVGWLERLRVENSWSWCVFLHQGFCLDYSQLGEVRDKIKELNEGWF